MQKRDLEKREHTTRVPYTSKQSSLNCLSLGSAIRPGTFAAKGNPLHKSLVWG